MKNLLFAWVGTWHQLKCWIWTRLIIAIINHVNWQVMTIKFVLDDDTLCMCNIMWQLFRATFKSGLTARAKKFNSPKYSHRNDAMKRFFFPAKCERNILAPLQMPSFQQQGVLFYLIFLPHTWASSYNIFSPVFFLVDAVSFSVFIIILYFLGIFFFSLSVGKL